MKVSVIVATLNSERTLGDCLRSIKAQTYPDIELLVVDNFSSDRTLEVAMQYADKVEQVGPERSAHH